MAGVSPLSILPPLSLLRQWREQGLSPQEVYREAEKYMLTVPGFNPQTGMVKGYPLKTQPRSPRQAEHLTLEKTWRRSRQARRRGVEPAPPDGAGWVRLPHCRRRHDPAELFRLYRSMTLREVGEIKGITAERVRQILRDAGYPTNLRHPRKTKPYPLLGQMIELRRQGLLYREIGERLQVATATVATRLRRAGHAGRLKKEFLPIGCDRCKTEPRARGMCNACYKRWYSRGKVEEDSPLPKTPLKPIGCPDCKIKPFVGDLCKRCYGRKKKRERRVSEVLS